MAREFVDVMTKSVSANPLERPLVIRPILTGLESAGSKS